MAEIMQHVADHAVQFTTMFYDTIKLKTHVRWRVVVA